MLQLSELQVGEQARIVGFNTQAGSYRQQLLALGLTPGTILKLIRVAPLGDPVQIQVLNSQLALRKNEACHLQLERI